MDADANMIFTLMTAIPAEGARIGLCTCTLCGATILVDSRDDIDSMQLHIDWHARFRAAAGEGS